MPERNDRIAALPRVRLERLPEPTSAPVDWPQLDGQIVIAFTSRVGSTFMSAEIERTRNVRYVAETFNEPLLLDFKRKCGAATLDAAVAEQMRVAATGGWFIGKMGVPGLSVAEKYGAIGRYLDRTTFIYLLRRDLAAQAVSIVTAEMSGQYHSTQGPADELSQDRYDEPLLIRRMQNVLRGCTVLSAYLEAARRPTDILFYEDIRDGDMSKPFAILDRLGVPKREVELELESLDVRPVTRSVSADWASRLRSAPGVKALIEQHSRLIDQAVGRYGG